MRVNVFPVPNLILPCNVLVSVSDKTDLDVVVLEILNVNPKAIFYSTGGTGKTIIEVLGKKAAENYLPVEEFTGMPEMDGGLVKTLHPKIHAGLLPERKNPLHEAFLKSLKNMGKGEGVYFDSLFCSFYPFADVIAKGCTTEEARSNIDIGGPAMVRAAAKNWHSVSVVGSPADYQEFIRILKAEGGISARYRFEMMRKAFSVVRRYDTDIDGYLQGLTFEQVAADINIED